MTGTIARWTIWLWIGLFAGLGHLCAQERDLWIIDPEGLPLEGVSVYARQQKQEWFSDASGRVRLSLTREKDTLLVRYFGFETEEWPAGELPDTLGLEPWLETLGEVIVTGRRDDPAESAIQQIAILPRADRELRQSTSTPAFLEQSGEVFVQRSQQGGGSPILRGFEANRILLVVDGVRLNNAIYRSGHLQNSLTIDPRALEQTEVILGPGSLLYGSDALGGVLHFRTQTPPLGAERAFTGQASYQFSSAARASAAHVEIGYGGEQWGSYTSLSWSDFGDLRSGARRPGEWPEFGKKEWYVRPVGGQDSILMNPDPEVQRFSGYSQLDLLQKVRYRPNRFLDLEGNVQFSTSSDIPRYDALIETRNDLPRFAEWNYGPQTRLLTALTARHRRSNLFYDRARFQASFQFIEEDRINRAFRDPWREFNLEEVLVGGLNVDLDRGLDRSGHWLLKYGGELQFNQVNSEAYRDNIEEGERRYDINTRYPGGGSQFWQGGLYSLLEWTSPDSVWQLEGGLRYSFTRLQARFTDQGPIAWPKEFLEGITSFSQALTGSGGIRWRPGRNWTVYLLSATAFRAPNLDDSGKIRENNGFVTIPNPDLEPEKAWTSEIRAGKAWQWGPHRLQVGAGAFFTRLTNLLTRADFQLPNGDPFFVSRGDTLFVQANVNADRGRIWGGTASLEWQFRDLLHFRWTQTLTYGEKNIPDPAGNEVWVPLEHIPPHFGRAALRYSLGRFRLEAAIRYQGPKRPGDYGVTGITIDPVCGRQFQREGSSDNIEYGLVAAPDNPCESPYRGLYGWATLDFYSSWRITPWLSLDLAVENILDQHYRTFGSGISAPGRDWKVGIRLGL